MITVQQLVRRRIISNLLYQYKALRSAVDWTVALYLVIPAIAMAMYEYIRMWLFPPEWFYVLPYKWKFDSRSYWLKYAIRIAGLLQEQVQLIMSICS
ncbi:hypothetical protein P7H16_07455 [Paenibacillus larvae]|nr:hypothetical protein [Paenibacillus larvae]MDT2246820.1 hypothetical protein [Paenibacillus larvae]